ncbi:MAG: RNA methyltransferase [Rhizobiaceae bacterium]|nr:RNA methyltransferase [Rhizobiaceae bacterium]
MSDTPTPKKTPRTMSDEHNRFHAEKRRARRDAKAGKQSHNDHRQKQRFKHARENTVDLLFYGLHTVRHAIINPARQKHRLFATANALKRLELDDKHLVDLPVEEKSPRELDKMVGSEAVHQGVVLHVSPIEAAPLSELGDERLVLVLDQVTDPHNVGAIMRSAVALEAGAVITTSRYSPVESGVLAKSASGALDLVRHIEVRNLAEALETLHEAGFTTIGFDSEGDTAFEKTPAQQKIALVMGAEGKGLRQKTRETCNLLKRLDMPGEIKSLNVSNAAMLALYIARGKLV